MLDIEMLVERNGGEERGERRGEERGHEQCQARQDKQERMNKDHQGRPHGTAQSEDPDPKGLVLGGELDGACKGDQAWKSGDIGLLEILEVICLKCG